MNATTILIILYYGSSWQTDILQDHLHYAILVCVKTIFGFIDVMVSSWKHNVQEDFLLHNIFPFEERSWRQHESAVGGLMSVVDLLGIPNLRI